MTDAAAVTEAVTEADIDAMTDEQVTLHLARAGHSPEDMRRSYERMARRLDELRLFARPNDEDRELMNKCGGVR